MQRRTPYLYTAAILFKRPNALRPATVATWLKAKPHEEVAHEKLVTRLARLRNAASEAVLWEDHAKLVQVAKAFTCVTPTKRAIAETGVGHLLADKTVWVKGGDAAVSFAKKALTDWKEKVKHTFCDRQLTAAGRRPLVAMKAKMYMDYVNDFVDWLKTVDEVPADPVCRKKLAATLVQHSAVGSTSTPSTQTPCKCYIRHRLRCSAARPPGPHDAGGVEDQCSKTVALQVPN